MIIQELDHAFPFEPHPSLMLSFLRGNYSALPRLCVLYSSSTVILGHPEMSLSVLFAADPQQAPQRPRGGRSFARTLPGWSLSGAQTWACNWLRQLPLVLSANKVKVHPQWQLAFCSDATCHVIKSRENGGGTGFGRDNSHALIWEIAFKLNQTWFVYAMEVMWWLRKIWHFHHCKNAAKI